MGGLGEDKYCHPIHVQYHSREIQYGKVYSFTAVFPFTADPSSEGLYLQESKHDVTKVISLMLLSHQGEYVANGLSNAIRRQFTMI